MGEWVRVKEMGGNIIYSLSDGEFGNGGWVVRFLVYVGSRGVREMDMGVAAN